MNINKTVSKAAPLAIALGTTLVMAAMAQSALAQVNPDQVSLGIPNYNGSGCPLGSVSATLSPDAQSLSILFSGFEAMSGGSTGKTLDRKACNVAIPVHVPQGFSVSMLKMDYRGYHRIPQGASGTFDIEYFFAGETGPAYRKTFVGASDGNFLLNNRVDAVATVWSACGADVNLRTNMSLAVQTNNMFEDAMLTLDSADIQAGIVYQLSWKRCGASNPYPTPYPTATPYYPPAPTPYQPAPTPYNPYPNPTPYQPQVGACVIESAYDYRGMQIFNVSDGLGRLVGTTVQYAEALRLAQQSEVYGSCRGIINRAAPYQPQPQRPNSCRIMSGRNAYGQILYRVLDRSSRILSSTTSLSEAQRIQQSDARCFDQILRRDIRGTVRGGYL